jgi:zinc protease
VSFGSDPRNVDRASKLIMSDLRALQNKPMSAQRLLIAKALVIGALPIEEESIGGVASQILTYVATGRPYNEDRIEARAQLRATGEDVRAALARYLRPGDFVQVIQGPAR